MDKFWRAEQFIRAECPRVRINLVEPASIPQLMRVHTAAYLTAIRTGMLSREALVRLGLPPCEELLTRSRRETAGTVAAMWAALEDGLACNLAGGTHHSFADRGLGYCVLNDVAIAIRDLHAIDPERRVFVIDTDAHQGNGTNEIFASDKRVFTYSIHVGRNYPAEKKMGSLDVELPRFVSGAEYLQQLDATLPAAFERFASRPCLLDFRFGPPRKRPIWSDETQRRRHDGPRPRRAGFADSRSRARGRPLRRRLQS